MRRAIGIGLLAAMACGQDIAPPPVRNLDRPSEMAFACYGDLRLNGGDPDAVDPDGAVTAQPLQSCVDHARGEPPPGQEDVVRPKMFGFVLQSTRGTVAVVDVETASVLDADPLSPGKNSIPIGTLPVGLVADRSGCYMVSANAGSCDLSVLDVTSAVATDSEEFARISRVGITTSDGELLRAKPRDMAADDQEEIIGLECPERASGLVYVAYPACHWVAAVNAETGEVAAGVQFAEDGTATITDGAVTCPSECGDGAIVPSEEGPGALPHGGIDAGLFDAGPTDAGPGADAGPPTTDSSAPRPVSLHRAPDGRLYIASENSPIVTAVELDDGGMPVATEQVQLEGAVGVTRVAVSMPVEMGGELGQLGGSAGSFQFMYAVATDRTVRVVDVERMIECDTQVDPRYLYEERDMQRLACLPVGDPATPPRRPSARSPGIHLAREAAPLDVAFAEVDPPARPPGRSPFDMVGVFAFVTSSDGLVYVVNVDDDNYPDFEDPNDPAAATVALTLPHQVRDFARGRDAFAQNCQPADTDPLALTPRMAQPPTSLISEAQVSGDKLHLLPNLRQVMCTAGDDELPVNELSFNAPTDLRESAFPDWKSTGNELWTLTWEGALSRDGASADLDGPPVRFGRLSFDAGRGTLQDDASPFCGMGAENYDVLQLLGCDPGFGDAQCGVGETCYVHPDAPATITSGVCMPTSKADSLSGRCRDFLITRRQYVVRDVHADHLDFTPRRRVLRTSPLTGCDLGDQADSDALCRDLAQLEVQLATPGHPVTSPAAEVPADQLERWVCASDPSRRGGPDRCSLECSEDDQCEEGFACHMGYCVEGAMPPEECVTGMQRYLVRASESFVAIGDRTGYLHNRVRDPDTGECVADEDASPLQIGRIPLDAPECVSDELTDVSPNPCVTTVEHAEVVTPFEEVNGRCDDGPPETITRDLDAIRFKNPAFTLHLVDRSTTGDAVCLGDRAGEEPPFSPVYPGYQFSFTIIGGFFPMFATAIEAAFPGEITPGPDGRLWVLDEGDASVSTQGRVYTVTPGIASEGFGVITIL